MAKILSTIHSNPSSKRSFEYPYRSMTKHMINQIKAILASLMAIVDKDRGYGVGVWGYGCRYMGMPLRRFSLFSVLCLSGCGCKCYVIEKTYVSPTSNHEISIARPVDCGILR